MNDGILYSKFPQHLRKMNIRLVQIGADWCGLVNLYSLGQSSTIWGKLYSLEEECWGKDIFSHFRTYDVAELQ